MSWLLVYPIIIPMMTAVASYLFRRSPAGRWISLGGTALLLLASGMLMANVLPQGVISAQMSNWRAPFGITLVADYLSAVMVVITAITGLATVVYSLSEIPSRLERVGFHALLQTLQRCAKPKVGALLAQHAMAAVATETGAGLTAFTSTDGTSDQSSVSGSRTPPVRK